MKKMDHGRMLIIGLVVAALAYFLFFKPRAERTATNSYSSNGQMGIRQGQRPMANGSQPQARNTQASQANNSQYHPTCANC